MRTGPGFAAPDDPAPLVLVERQRGAMRLTACDAQATALGLRVGLALADARARVPDLRTEPADPAADSRWLERMADACDRFTPLVATEPPDGLILDVTGCVHLFGSEAGLRMAVEQRMRRWVGHLHQALAMTPEAARALARYQAAPAASEAAALRRLPVAALEVADEAQRALRRAGLRTLGDLADRSAAELAARFGADLVDRLSRVLGHVDSRLSPRRAPPDLIFERSFADPLTHADVALAVIGDLAAEAERMLEARGAGGRRFVARLYRSDGHVIDLVVESSLPLRDPARILRLFGERVGALADPIDPGFGFDMIRLAVPRCEPLNVAQLALEGGGIHSHTIASHTIASHASAGEEVAALVDRLSTRVGRARIRRFVPRDTHLPEQATLALPAVEARNSAHAAPRGASWPMPQPGEPPARPIHLFDPPQPVDVVAAMPDGPPQRFRWRGTVHDVARVEGPERLAAQWWRRPPGNPGLTRDYYRIEDLRGRRYWLFRHGLQGAEVAEPRWYLHGLFA